MKNLIQNKKVYIYCFSILAFTSAIISFYLNINLSSINSNADLNEYLLKYNINVKSGGSVSDLKTHWVYMQILAGGIENLFRYELGHDTYTKLLNFPLHHIIISQIPIVSTNLKVYLLSFFLISLSLPILFYKCLIIRFPDIEKIKLTGLASIIYILPGFQYSAIWGNPHITALFFLLFSIYFFLKVEKSNYENKKYIFLSLIFLAFASYTKQFYVFLFPFILYNYFENTSFVFFIKLIFFTAFISLPGFLFLLKNPLLFKGLSTIDITDLRSSILIVASIIFFYILPIIFQYFLNNYNKKKFSKIFEFKKIFLVFCIFLLCVNNFYYNGLIGGGVIYKLSNIIFSNNFAFLFCSFLGLFCILFYSKKVLSNYLLTLLLLTTFSTGFFIFQKYLEPMFFILLLLFYDHKKITESISKNNLWVILYFSTYYIGLNFYNKF